MILGELILWIVAFSITAIVVIGSIISHKSYQKGSCSFELWCFFLIIVGFCWFGYLMSILCYEVDWSLLQKWWEIQL